MELMGLVGRSVGPVYSPGTLSIYMEFSVRIFRQMERYKFFNTLTGQKDAVPFENSILIALREPGSQKENGDRG